MPSFISESEKRTVSCSSGVYLWVVCMVVGLRVCEDNSALDLTGGVRVGRRERQLIALLNRLNRQGWTA
jgi:hypothetical protein